MLVHPSPSLSLSLVCFFFFETVRTFLVRKVGDGMPFITYVGEKEFEIVAYVLRFVCRMSSQVCHCLEECESIV